jgi:hypothetical protein
MKAEVSSKDRLKLQMKPQVVRIRQSILSGVVMAVKMEVDPS